MVVWFNCCFPPFHGKCGADEWMYILLVNAQGAGPPPVEVEKLPLKAREAWGGPLGVGR